MNLIRTLGRWCPAFLMMMAIFAFSSRPSDDLQHFYLFDYLENSYDTGKQYDVVILDPPAFAKNKKSIPTALKGYEKLNKLALQVINDDGFLITSSCSHHITKDEFISAINKASIKVNKNIQLVYFNGASLDHPQLPAMPETDYLKFAVFRV